MADRGEPCRGESHGRKPRSSSSDWSPRLLAHAGTDLAEKARCHKVGKLVRELASHGLAVLVISHDIHHFVLDNTDRIEVLRLGRNAGSFNSKDVTGEQVVNVMVGGDESVNMAG